MTGALILDPCDKVRGCPQNIQESIRAYVQGRPTGGFLRAVLENNLLDAVTRADHINSKCLPAILAFVYTNVPSPMWGSHEAVAEHLRVSAADRNLSRGPA